jgi:hypothetical protein
MFTQSKMQIAATEQKEIMQQAMDRIEEDTCLEFVARQSETAYISIKNSEDGCWAELGFLNKKQEINMAAGCFDDVRSHLISNDVEWKHNI